MTVPVVDAKKVRCPHCFSDTGQRSYGRTGNVAYYRCTRCVFPDHSGDHTKYKVIFV